MPVGWNWMNSMSCSGRGGRGGAARASPVPGAGMRRGAGRIGAAVAAGGEDGGLRAEPMQRAVVEFQRDHAAANTLVVHDQVDGEKLDVEFWALTQRLAVPVWLLAVPVAAG